MSIGTFHDYLYYGLGSESSGLKGSILPTWVYKVVEKTGIPHANKIKLVEDLGRAGYEGVKFYTSDFFAEEAPAPVVRKAAAQGGMVAAGPELALGLIPRTSLEHWTNKWVLFRDGAAKLLEHQRAKGAPQNVLDELMATVEAAAATLQILYSVEDLKMATTGTEVSEALARIAQSWAWQRSSRDALEQAKANSAQKASAYQTGLPTKKPHRDYTY